MSTELLTVREVARRLKVHPYTVRRWIREGMIPASKIGRKEWRIREEDMDRYLTRGEVSISGRSEVPQELLALREEMEPKLTAQEAEDIVAQSRRLLQEQASSGNATADRRAAAVRGILALREQLRGRGISARELIAESRRELEARGARSSH